jgi:hypothetical protein
MYSSNQLENPYVPSLIITVIFESIVYTSLLVSVD